MYSLSHTIETYIIEIDVGFFCVCVFLFLLLLFLFFSHFVCYRLYSFHDIFMKRKTGLHKAHLRDNQLISIQIINYSSLIVIRRLLHIFFYHANAVCFRRFGPYNERK